jgi:hypothetical protein
MTAPPARISSCTHGVAFDAKVHGHRKDREEVIAQLRANLAAYRRPKLR